MALSITGLDSNGRVTPRGTNIVIPAAGAGIGDLIYKSGSSVKVIACGTASGSSITINGTTYTLYGAIYGFVNGEAMVVAPNDLGNMTWGAYKDEMSTVIVSPGSVLMRNGVKTSYYAQMNTERNRGYISGGSGYPENGILQSAYQACGAESGFTGTPQHGTFTEYIRQTLRVNGAPGSPFGAVAPDVKVHEFGRWMTKKFGPDQTSGAIRACYIYKDGGGTWWLPSMFELGELMIDEHLNRVNSNGVMGSISAWSVRWSCVLCSGSDAWLYNDRGVSDNGRFGYSFTVRPVTLFKLI